MWTTKAELLAKSAQQAQRAVSAAETDACAVARSKHDVAPARCAPNRHYSEGLALVSDGGVHLTDSFVKSFVKMGYVDMDGKWVISSRYKYFFWYDFFEGVVPFRENFERWGYMDRTGEIVIRPSLNWAGGFGGGIAPVLTPANMCAHMNKAGVVIDQPMPANPQASGDRNRAGVFTCRPYMPPCA